MRARLFEPFARSQRAVDSGTPGSDLGLAITRELARAQGGEVWYEDAAGGGACFGVRLPVAPAEAILPQVSDSVR